MTLSKDITVVFKAVIAAHPDKSAQAVAAYMFQVPFDDVTNAQIQEAIKFTKRYSIEVK